MDKKNKRFSVMSFLVLMLVATLLSAALMLVSCSSSDSEKQGTDSEKSDASALLPDDFAFKIIWNCYGDSTYDSKSGQLVKQKSATKLSDYTTTLILTDEQKLIVYKLLTEDIDLYSYPSSYDPFYPQMSEPTQTIIVSLTANGKTKSVGCIDVAIGEADDCSGKKDKDFLNVVNSIIELLMETEEWKVLPEVEHLYL